MDHSFINIFRLTWVKIHGTKYTRGCIVVSKVEDDVPQFSQIVDILLDENGVYFFVLNKLPPPHYCEHYHAFAVDHCTSQNICLIKQHELADYHSYCFHQTFDVSQRSQHFIVLKHYVLPVDIK